MESSDLSKWFVFLGIGLIFLGGIIWLATKAGIPFGKMPGDVSVKGENYSVYFPIVTSILISIILTILINLFFFFRK